MLNVISLALDPTMTRIGTTVFRKQLLRFGRWIHPADSSKFFEVDRTMCDKLVQNFNLSNYNDFIPVLMAQDQADPHKVLPTDTVGRIVGLQVDTDGLYSLIEFGMPEVSDKAAKNLIPGVSAGISLEYKHKETGNNVGPVLKHVVLCNEPYIKNLRGFQQVQLSELSWDILEFAEVQRTEMKRDQLELIAKKLGVDLTKFAADDALLAEVTRLVDVATVNLAEVPNLKTKATAHDTLLAENTTLKSENATLKTAAPDKALVVELGEKLKVAETTSASLATKVTELELSNKKTAATAKVDGFVTKGQILPAHREQLIELAVSNPTMFDQLYNASSPVLIKLSDERGFAPSGNSLTGSMSPAQIKAEVDRLATAYVTPAARK